MLDTDFMLSGETSEVLYNNIAKNAPIYDYHCHPSAKDVEKYKCYTLTKLAEEYNKKDFTMQLHRGIGR